MTADALLVVQLLFGEIWRLFTSWNIPGTSASPAEVFVFVAFVGLIVRSARSLLALGSDMKGK